MVSASCFGYVCDVMELSADEIYRLLRDLNPGQFTAGASILIGLNLWFFAVGSARVAMRRPWPPEGPPDWVYFAVLMAPALLFAFWMVVSLLYIALAIWTDFSIATQEGFCQRPQLLECPASQDHEGGTP